MTDNRIVVCGVHTASPIATAYLDLSPDIRSRAEEIAGSNRPVTWPELLLMVGQAILHERFTPEEISALSQSPAPTEREAME